jgi:Zn-dependent metalloprotease
MNRGIYPIWENAGWSSKKGQVVYGQVENSRRELISFASSLTIVAHEIFHGITYFGPNLGGRGQSGALNESYSDIFAVIIANRNQPYISQWNWEIGEPLTNCGFQIRNLQCPEKYDHPANLRQYQREKKYADERGKDITENKTHFNNGIHNKAAYNIIMATKKNSNEYLFNQPGDSIKISSLFHRGLLGLDSSSKFRDSGRSLVRAGNIVFENDARISEVNRAIRNAFYLVGVTLDKNII